MNYRFVSTQINCVQVNEREKWIVILWKFALYYFSAINPIVESWIVKKILLISDAKVKSIVMVE